MPKGYDLFLSSDKEVKASAVETVMRSSGWVPRVEAPSYKDNTDQDAERQPAKAEKKAKTTNRQKSWVPWPKA
ncbi:hypothetical protein [Pontibacter cellulosilyticus]|uniref:Uncharacterized protein n=1 Tax=Pontibacter cellulosilyticus TaxID=1720253 RepID=A0A923SKZ8_9BACT|nr:hypothetical protein [Pontibacter cellulosilyticus]MBC5994316.1 hypothetical protein [Pontibacter cellulosilyticus]